MANSATNGAINGWTLLRSGSRQSAGLEIFTVPTEVASASGPVRFALGENGEARVLLPLALNETLRGLVGAPTLQISVSTFSSSGKNLRFLDLICHSSDLEPVFAEVVDEILMRIAAGDGCVDAARSTIDDFRTLLVQPSSNNVSKSVVAGLVGELIVLNRLLDRSTRAWCCWRGPTGDRHDFRSGDSSIEVKSTLRASSSSISANDLYQFEAPLGGTLHLVYFVLEPVAAGELNVSTLGNSIIAKSDDPNKVKELFFAVGCTDVNADSWNSHSFRLESQMLYEVSDGFPRLVPSMLPNAVAPAGVSEVSYKIDLSAAKQFIKEPSQLDEIEKTFVECL